MTTLDAFRYTPGAIQSLADHYYDDHLEVVAVDAFADFDRSLRWLNTQAPELHHLLHQVMAGYGEADLALVYHLRPRTLARLLDQTFVLLASYLNSEYPLEIPVLDALQTLERPYVPPFAALDEAHMGVLLALTTITASVTTSVTTSVITSSFTSLS